MERSPVNPLTPEPSAAEKLVAWVMSFWAFLVGGGAALLILAYKYHDKLVQQIIREFLRSPEAIELLKEHSSKLIRVHNEDHEAHLNHPIQAQLAEIAGDVRSVLEKLEGGKVRADDYKETRKQIDSGFSRRLDALEAAQKRGVA